MFRDEIVLLLKYSWYATRGATRVRPHLESLNLFFHQVTNLPYWHYPLYVFGHVRGGYGPRVNMRMEVVVSTSG